MLPNVVQHLHRFFPELAAMLAAVLDSSDVSALKVLVRAEYLLPRVIATGGIFAGIARIKMLPVIIRGIWIRTEQPVRDFSVELLAGRVDKRMIQPTDGLGTPQVTRSVRSEHTDKHLASQVSG